LAEEGAHAIVLVHSKQGSVKHAQVATPDIPVKAAIKQHMIFILNSSHSATLTLALAQR
jgi:hypothetical protein